MESRRKKSFPGKRTPSKSHKEENLNRSIIIKELWKFRKNLHLEKMSSDSNWVFIYLLMTAHRLSLVLASLMTCLLRNLYAGQEATVRTGHGTTDWFQIGKGVRQGCILSPCSFNLYAEYIMRNTGLEEAQVGIKIARRNINNLRYADDTTLMAES